MARVTVEDCLDHVDNRFDLVLKATKRARQLSNGKEPFLDWDNDKPAVVALCEIAAGLITEEVLNAKEVVVEEEVVTGDDEEEEMIDFEELLAFPEYRSWAKSKGLDPDTWLKKFMRVQAMLMKEAMGEGASEGQAQMKAQLAEMEARRAQMGEEMYQQMKQAMEAGAMALDNVNTAYEKLPDPMPSEKELINRYRDQLMNLE